MGNDEKRLSGRLAESLRIALEKDRILSVLHLAVLLYVAKNPGCLITDIMRVFGLAHGTATRALQRLSTGSDVKEVGKGLGFIYREPDPALTSRLLCYLTEEGKVFISSVLHPLGK